MLEKCEFHIRNEAQTFSLVRKQQKTKKDFDMIVRVLQRQTDVQTIPIHIGWLHFSFGFFLLPFPLSAASTGWRRKE